jgi:hypothetical protein
MKATRRIFATLSVLAFLSGCGDRFEIGESANTPTEMFEYIIEKPVPPTVRNLEGGGCTWQGYSIYLRFTADAGFSKRLIADGFKETDWKSIGFHFKLPETNFKFKEKFSTPWNPRSIKHKRCFEKEVTNSWTHSGTHYFVVDEDRGAVYFYGVGA